MILLIKFEGVDIVSMLIPPMATYYFSIEYFYKIANQNNKY